MTGSIFKPADNDSLIARIEKLNPQTEAKWGKMSVDQMLKHCCLPIDVAFGTLHLKIPLVFRIMGRLMKNKWLNNDFAKNSPTAKELLMTEHYDFESVKKELIEKVKRFAYEENVIKITVHPFWGKMSREDWDKLQWRHLDHHLRQFGV